MEEFNEYLSGIDNAKNREILMDFLSKIHLEYPELGAKIAWGMPVFTLGKTFILGISAFKEHFSIAPEPIAIVKFAQEINNAKYKSTKGLFKIKWTDEINYKLIYDIIESNIADKADCNTFWRK